MPCDRCQRRIATVLLERGHFACDEECGCKLRRGHRVVSYLCAICAGLTPARPE